MPEEPEVPRKEIETIQEEVSELVRRALIQTGDLQAVEEKLKLIVEKSSKSTPPPGSSAGDIPKGQGGGR
jgi:hypothetical protein